MTALTADLLCALRGAGYHVDLNGNRLHVKPPASGMSTDLRARIADHRDEIKALLASPDSLADCTPCDDTLLVVEARRLDHDRLAALVTHYVDRYGTTGNAVDIEIAAWFATAEATRRHLAEHDHHMPPPDAPVTAVERVPDSSWNGWEPFGESREPPVCSPIYVCTGCGLPRSRRPEPCPACGSLSGRNSSPDHEAA